MLGKLVIDNIEKWDYTKQRAIFLSFSAGFRILIQRVKEKHDLANKIKEFNKTTHTFDFMTFANKIIYPEMNRDINDLASFFHMSDLFIGDALMGKKNLYLAESWIVRRADSDDPIIEEGFYIRVDQATPFSSVKQAYHEIKYGYKLQNQSANRKIQVRGKRNRQLDDLIGRLKMFDCIEKLIYKEYLLKQKGIKDKRSSKIYNPDSLVLEGIRYYSEELAEKGKGSPSINTLDSRYYEIYSYFNIPSFQECRRISF